MARASRSQLHDVHAKLVNDLCTSVYTHTHKHHAYTHISNA